MISICIPVYNFNIVPLLTELSKQSKILDTPVEIILIDDCSSDEFKNQNGVLCKKHNYIELKENIGRAKIRNLFLEYAQYDNLLFLDCDSLIISKYFVEVYLNTIRQDDYNIICGGRVYDRKKPKRNKRLNWKYGVKRESQTLMIREFETNKSFMTNNFLIKKKILEEVKFDERIVQYGHEDTLFGFELKKRNISIRHIDNPVLNGDIEENSEYLKKTEIGIINLIHILKYVENNNAFIDDVTILNFYRKLSSKKLINLIGVIFICFKPILKVLLVQGYVNLGLFDFYKLGILIRNYK